METLRCDLADDGIATLTFDEPGSPVNTMKLQWQLDLAEAVDALARDRDKLRGVLLTSAKRSFFAGADLKGVLELTPQDAAPGFARIEAMKRSLRRLETLGRPVVALLAGSALGGGWEVALAAHARFALDDRQIRFGTPEVSLGLIPGATGITKTVRLLGLMAAQPFLVEGRLFGPREALELGLVTGLATTPEELRSQALAWIDAHPDAVQPWGRPGHRLPGGDPSNPKIAAALAVAPAMLARKTRGLYPAAQAILETMVEGARVDYDTATRIESRKLAKVMVGQTTKNMVNAFFFDLNRVRSGHARPAGVAPWRPARVGVLGAGMMGAGIAHALAARGIACVLKDVDAARAAAGVAAIRRLVTAPAIERGRLTADGEAELLARIRPTGDVADLRDSDCIIEAVFEQRALKAEVTREAEPMLAAGGFFATNTSTLPIAGLAAASARPSRFVGLHFFSPVHKMKLVEIIRGPQTDAETLAHAFDLVLAIGKLPIVVNDARGFFTSRVFGTYVMEGAAMLAEGVPAPLVEQAALAVGMPVGPLAVLDETSLALSVQVLAQTRADVEAEGGSYRAGPGELLVERMVAAWGRSGRAAGGGFYDYPAGGAKTLWPGLRTHFERADRPAPALSDLGQRLLYRPAIEAARCLAEGVITSRADANIGSIFGIGFPAWTGGALQFVESEGRSRFIENAARLAEAHGAGYLLSDEVLAALERRDREVIER